MRLTLRTLLAYLDGILEPKDAEDLGKKIEESEYATGLVHRVRDVMRRLRLGAPSVTDRGPGLDPNTVAEYLDNTLSPDRVTDFEKVCLDSDTHLAEVAASHQILTLVLGEPAEIDETTRQRMYEVKDVSDGPKPPPPPPVRAPDSAATESEPSLSLDLEVGDDIGGRKPRPRPTVPEYLREPRRGRRRNAILSVIAVACAILLILGLFDMYKPGTPIGNLLVSMGIISPPKETAKNQSKDIGKTKETDNDKTQKENPLTKPSNSDAGKPATDKPEVEPAGKSVEPAAKASDTNDKEKLTPPVVKPPANEVKETKTPEPPKPTQKPNGGTTKNLPPPPDAPAPPKVPDNPPSKEQPKPDGDAGKEPAPMPLAEPEPLGRFLSADQVLLSDSSPNGWTRVAANQMLIPQQVLSLPTFRPKLSLTSGVTVELVGGARVELLASSGKALPGVRVMFGRVVLVPLGKAETRLRVEFGNRHGTLTFADAKSIVALDVRRIHAPGTNPESETTPVDAELFVTGGAVSWEETIDGKVEKPQPIEPSHRLAFDAQPIGEPVAVKEMPKWIDADAAMRAPVSPREQLERSKSSPVIAQAIPTDQPARLELLVLATTRPQWEVKWLALRCLTYVGQFHDLVVLLNDPAQKAHWPDYIDALRAAVDRDAETAAAVRLALEKQFPQQAADLYRMLWRYTDKQLELGDDGKGGEDAKLVRALDDDLLAVRVLTYANLKEITGKGEIYRPEFTAARRQQGIRIWQRRLEANDIRWVKAEPKPRSRTHEKATTPAPKRSS